MLLRHVNASLQISRGIFGYDEIIQTHTMPERNFAVMKQPRNGNSKAKKLTKINAVYTSYQSQLIGWMHMLIFTQISHS